MPTGFDFDYVDLDALETRFSVSGGSLAAGDVSYRLLYLGGSSSRMTVRALRALVALVDAGATVAGHRPTGSPSLADDDAEHAELCDRLWGAGRVRDTDDLAAVLSELGVRRTLVVDGPEVLRIGRRTAVGELHFVANPSPEPVSLGLSTPDGQPLIAWDPVTLRRAALSDTGTGHRLDLPALGSVFLLPGGHADEARSTVAERHLDGAWRLALPGVLDDELPAGPVPWTDLGGKAAGFAGTGTYTTEVDVEHRLLEGHAVVLELGDVGDVARVRINGVEQGIVWTAPWQLEVTGSLRAGRNLIEVSVANAWMNRLIAEAASPTGEIFGPVAEVYAPDAPLHAAGLSGPVQLRILR